MRLRRTVLPFVIVALVTTVAIEAQEYPVEVTPGKVVYDHHCQELPRIEGAERWS